MGTEVFMGSAGQTAVMTLIVACERAQKRIT